jgi:hypothetical protein
LVNALKDGVILKYLKPSSHRLSASVPLLSEITFTNLEPSLEQALKTLLPTLESSFPPINDDLCRLESAWQSGLIELSTLAEECLKGRSKSFQEAVRCTGISPDNLIFSST